MRILLNSIAATSSLIGGVIFLRFWREAVDRLFAMFAVAFWLFALNYFLLALLNTSDETRAYLFLPRLTGFIVILIAIVDKSRR